MTLTNIGALFFENDGSFILVSSFIYFNSFAGNDVVVEKARVLCCSFFFTILPTHDLIKIEATVKKMHRALIEHYRYSLVRFIILDESLSIVFLKRYHFFYLNLQHKPKHFLR